jgi:hypothetical protein
MLVRYRMTANTTYANMVSDVYKIVSGTASNVAQLSANTDQSNTVFYGTYPSSYVSVANTASNTFAKIHSTVGSKTHYVRLNWDNVNQKLDSIALAQSYASANDTLINSTTLSANVSVVNYVNTNVGIDIVVSPQIIYIGQGGNAQGGAFDIGHNGVTRVYTDSMLTMLLDLSVTVTNEFVQSELTGASGATMPYTQNLYRGATIPYTYNYDTLSYGSATPFLVTNNPIRKINTNGSVSIFENPAWLTNVTTGYTLSVVYGLYKLPRGAYAGNQTYIDGTGLRRLTTNDFSLLTY